MPGTVRMRGNPQNLIVWRSKNMVWREAFIRWFGPGLFGGTTFGKWMHLLWDNNFAVSPSRWTKTLTLTGQCAPNSLFRWMDQRKMNSNGHDIEVPPPVFVIGHWRTGTTHLHQLLTVDRRFAYPNNYQVMYPDTFLTGESVRARMLGFFLPGHRPMDNVNWTILSPQEDEFALCVLTSLSPYMSFAFPRRREHYDRYLTLRDVDEGELAEWKAAMRHYLQKLTWKLQRPLVLKSPPHTCRIRLLLELFPEAKFVHIHRNPYDVFPSSRRMFEANFAWHGMQRPRLHDLDDWILKQYRTMFEVFFEERGLIPAGHYHEVAYEDVERDPVGQVQRIYEALNLPPFEEVKPDLEQYVQSIAGYQKNSYPELPPELRRRIAEQWKFCFEEWGYPL